MTENFEVTPPSYVTLFGNTLEVQYARKPLMQGRSWDVTATIKVAPGNFISVTRMGFTLETAVLSAYNKMVELTSTLNAMGGANVWKTATN